MVDEVLRVDEGEVQGDCVSFSFQFLVLGVLEYNFSLCRLTVIYVEFDNDGVMSINHVNLFGTVVKMSKQHSVAVKLY